MSRKNFLPRRVLYLRGKLTLTYTLTTIVMFMFIVIVVVGIALWISSQNISFFVLNDLKQEAPQAGTYFVHGSPDSEGLTAWLKLIDTSAFNKQGPFSFSHPTYLAVIDTRGKIITSVGTHPLSPGTLLQPQLSPQGRANLNLVLHDVHGTTSKINAEQENTLLAMIPITVVGGNVKGVLIMKIVAPNNLQLLVEFIQFIGLLVVITTIGALILGTVSGYLTSRGITRRLKGLEVAADHWSRGDFSVHVQDASADELGQTGRQLNKMAEQLQNLLQTRQKLATLEERNRLARDLHDSVKQQIFSVALQIGATRLLLKRDVDAAEVRLTEAQKLIKQAQQELTSLIRELRPVALEDKGLPVALHELATQWTRQTDIVANLLVEGPQQTLPLTVEEALYRIAQEALANVARHSKASLVQMLLAQNDDTITLSIIDNGQGFDTTRNGHLGVGLLSMRERMNALGGDVQIESTPGNGTRIIAHCPRRSSGLLRDTGQVLHSSGSAQGAAPTVETQDLTSTT